jgi:hypothetical protein
MIMMVIHIALDVISEEYGECCRYGTAVKKNWKLYVIGKNWFAPGLQKPISVAAALISVGIVMDMAYQKFHLKTWKISLKRRSPSNEFRTQV